MSTVNITIDDAEVLTVIARVAQRADDLTPFFTEWGTFLVTSTQRRFHAQVDPTGMPWTPLAPSTLKRKAKRARTRILHDQGHLRQSLTFLATRTELQVGTNMPYGPTHQFGAIIHRYAHTRTDRFIRFRDVEATRKDGSTYTAKRFAKDAHRKISAMARMKIGEATITIPARPFLGLSVQDVAAGRRIATRYLAEPMGGGGA